MKVFVISLRNLIIGAVVFLVVLIGVPLFLWKGSAGGSSSLKENQQAVMTAGVNPFESPRPSLALDVTVDGTTADVKLLTQNFQFEPKGSKDSEKITHGVGHAHLYLDGTMIGKVYENEFLLKKLPKGEHELRVELVYGNHLPYQVEAVKILNVK